LKLKGISRNDDILEIDGSAYDLPSLVIKVNLVDRLLLAEVLRQKFNSIPEYDHSKETKEDSALQVDFEERQRENSSLEMTEVEQRAYQQVYLCTVAGYHVYGSWLEHYITRLRLDFTGDDTSICEIAMEEYFPSRLEIVEAVAKILTE
jgi:hypothetical protein